MKGATTMLDERNNNQDYQGSDENYNNIDANEKISSSFDDIEEKNMNMTKNTSEEKSVSPVECDTVNSYDASSEISESVSEFSEDVLVQQENTVSENGTISYFGNTSDSGYAGGVYYTKNVDGNISNGYEWDTKHEKKTKKEKKSKSSSNGFRAFLAITLSVFTVSLIALTAMVAGYINDGKNVNNTGNMADKLTTGEKFDYNSVTVENPNFVAFDFAEHEGKILSIPEIAAKCSPSSVGIVSQIETTTTQSLFPFYFNTPSTRIAEASGSGFVYSSDGYIITNHHVIENASKITVILYDNTEYEATLVGSDSLSDIAVLKITPVEGTPLIPMEIGNSDELVVGEGVVAIGCPAGVEFIGTVTDGIVSAINRNIEITDDYGNVQKNMTLIQTNATINHGNSGGPLINAKGQVIGINTLKLSANYEGIGFSIPINGATPIIKQLIEHGKVVERTDEDFAYGQGIIGINGSAISQDEAEYYGIPQGVLVVQINKGSSASVAGLRRGDIITHYNGKEVKTVEDINTAKGSARAGTEVTLTVYRDADAGKGDTIDITFKLDSQQ